MISNPVRGRFNAWLLDVLDGYMHAKYGAFKTSLLGKVPPLVVEIGPGAGANFRYYPAGTHVIAVEPNVSMHERLRRHSSGLGLRLGLHPNGAEALSLASESVDLVFATLVLCSVSEARGALSEARGVIRPGGGRFVCIEHVPAGHSAIIGRLQRVIRGPWRWLFEGCDLHNNTEELLRTAGFRELHIQPFTLRTVFLPIRYQITAVCTM